jgi:uncharacterized membrane protein YebE (DUF533 family)
MKKLARLTSAERLQLLKFVCAAVWADLEVSEPERLYILGLSLRLGLPENELAQVRGWLETPPPPEEVDPARVPPEHRQLLLDAVGAAIAVDGVVDSRERESLRLLQELIG